MPEMPLTINGVTRLVWVDPLTEDTWNATQHQYRRLGVMRRRSYYEGTQYDLDNLQQKKELYPGSPEAELIHKTLPEHRRKHAYSGTIKEGIDFLADQVTGDMVVSAAEQDLVDAFFEEAGMQTRKEEIVREVLIAGDVFARLKPLPMRALLEPDRPAVKVEFWEAEDVEIDYDPDDWEKMVEVRFEEWRSEANPQDGKMEEVRYVHQFRLEPFITPDERIVMEAVERIFRGDEDEPVEVRRLGLPFLPWVHIHGEQESLRSKYGKPIISGALMETADRYNAVSHLEFLAVRYNSFGNLAVTGDAAHLKIENATSIPKDIADVLSFPGGTNVTSVSLDINVEAYAAQKKQLEKEMYDLMGLEQIDQETLGRSGHMSGYALEILNRKTDGTFRRMVANLKQGLQELVDMALKVDAIARGQEFVTDEDGEEIRAWWMVDPDSVYPDRSIDIEFGTAYIVDEVAVRDDYVAGIISLDEALRRKGYDPEDIEKIKAEMAEQSAAEEARLSATLTQGTRISTERS